MMRRTRLLCRGLQDITMAISVEEPGTKLEPGAVRTEYLRRLMYLDDDPERRCSTRVRATTTATTLSECVEQQVTSIFND